MAVELLNPRFWYELATVKPHYAPTPGLLAGRVAVVTGASAGLGLETAVHLAELEPKVLVLAVRNVEKGEKAKDYVVAKTGIEPDKIKVWELDLAKFDSVKAFATRCSAELERLDILVNNAGLNRFKWKMTSEGHEELFQVMVLSTGLLSLLLLPLIDNSFNSFPGEGANHFNPHITTVASSSHGYASYTRPSSSSLILDLDDPNSNNGNPTNRYAITKLLQVFITRKLASLPLAERIVVNSVHPNLCKSELGREFNPFIHWLFNRLAWKTKTGAACIAWAATSPTPPGAYVKFTKVVEPSAFSMSEAGLKLQDDFWKELTEFWAGLEPEVGKSLK